MRIKRVKISNWRSIKFVDITCENLMVFIGQNNHGKSNVLSAILFFFGQQTCSELDFCKGKDEVYVEITFCDLDDHDKAQFRKYLTTEETITVRKQIKKGETHEYHGFCQVPAEEWLKESNVGNYTTRESVAATPLAQLVPPTGRLSKEIIKAAQEEYLSQNAGAVQSSYELETTNFMGLKTVAQGIFGDVFFVPAVKKASEEFNLTGKTVFNQLLTKVINDMSVGNPEYMQAKQKIAELTQILNKKFANGNPNEARPSQITQLEQLLEAELASWQTTIEVEITPPDVDEVLRVGTSVWVDDGIATDVNRKGNGLQRSLIFALIKSWAKVMQSERDAAAGSTAEGDLPRRASRSTYFIFEEPELYLHPQAQRELYHSLKKLSEETNQVMLCTHSSAFIDLQMHKSICVVYKNDVAQGTKHLQCTAELFTATEEKKNFNLTYWVNPDRGELFFAKKVILVEGASDKSVLPLLAKKLGVFRYDYTIIDCGGKDNIPMYIHLLNSFKLPYVVVYDQDHQATKDPNGIASANTSSAAITTKIDAAYGSSVMLINDIEEEIGITSQNSKNKPYVAIEHVSQAAFTATASLEQKVRNIYS